MDAPNGADADITLGYVDTDAALTISQGGVSTTSTRDAAGRRSLQTTTTDSSTTTVARHYSDDSDNPAWSRSVTGNASSITRYAESIGGDLDVSIDSTGTKVALGNLHGDTVTTVTVPNGQTSIAAATAIDGWSDYEEYGTPRDLATTSTIGGPLGYGWLGQKQRSATDATAGLTLMGARLYNPTRGLFATVDPIDGGSDSSYAYPTDPINQADATGLWWSRKKWKRAWNRTKSFGRKVGRVAYRGCQFGQFVPGAVGVGCSAYRVGYAAAFRRRDFRSNAIGAVGAFAGAKKARALMGYGRPGRKAWSRVGRYRFRYAASNRRYARNVSSWSHGIGASCAYSRKRSCLWGG